jgi:hypothetical protein
MKRLIVLSAFVSLLAISEGCKLANGGRRGTPNAPPAAAPYQMPRMSLPWQRSGCDPCGSAPVVGSPGMTSDRVMMSPPVMSGSVEPGMVYEMTPGSGATMFEGPRVTVPGPELAPLPN